MANCVIHPVPLVEIALDKSVMTYWLNYGQPIRVTGYVWYIEGAGERILVDAGSSAEYVSRLRGIPAKDIQPLDSGLDKLGVSLSDIDLIILTHLHYDHVAQASQFPKARFLVQRDELEFAQNPHPVFASVYIKELFEELNFEVVNGDTKISEEVSVLSTPGHSPGGQSVSIKTAQGVVIIAGLCTIRENFEPSSPVTLPVITPGVHINALKAYDSLLRVKEMADVVVPLHEPEFQQKRRIP